MNEDFYISLIYKQLEGELSVTELIQLKGWLDASKESQALADDLKDAYKLSEDYLSDELEDIDVDAAFARQMELIGEDEIELKEDNEIERLQKEPSKVVQMQPRKRSRGLYRYLSVAAAIIVVVVAGLWVSDLSTGNTSNPSMVETANEIKEFTLSDGSIITLGTNSEIEIGQFNDQTRAVRLTKGSAKFSVTKDKGKFFVDTQYGDVTVLGTIFNVTTGDVSLKVEVEEGKVSVKPTTLGYISYDYKVELTENEAVELSSGTFVKWNKENGQKHLEFKNVSVQTITTFLEKHYNVTIRIDENISNCKMTRIFKEKTLEEILKIIDKQTNSSTIKKSDGSYEMNGNGC